MGNVNLAIDTGQRSGKLVAELDHVSKSFGEHCVVRDYSTTIMRGDRIGLIGPNGAGKSTLLRLIVGTLEPDSGSVRLGTNLAVAYFDQMRSQLDETATLADVINPGSEWIEIGGTRKHVMSYLGDFLFSPARAQSPVSSLSGGERARLLLARLFARPANVLVLDEPTNDLDIETLELLEELLQEYSGTVLLVSHDRSFLDNVVTQTIVSEGEGRWKDYVGGYADWEQQTRSSRAISEASGSPRSGKQQGAEAARQVGQSAAAPAIPATSPAASTAVASPCTAQQGAPTRNRAGRMAPWELRELEEIPAQISTLEQEQESLTTQLGDSALYRDDPSKVAQIQQRLAAIETDLAAKFERWEALEARAG